MKLSVWSEYLREMQPEEKFKIFAECGYKYLELSFEDGERLLQRGDPERTGRKLNAVAKEYDIHIEQGHLMHQADILNCATVEALKVWLDLFGAIGIKACVLHYGTGSNINIRPELLLQRRAGALRSLTDHIKGTDMIICLENLTCMQYGGCDVLLDIIHTVGGDNLGICLDTGHLHLSGGRPAQFIAEAGSLLHALHITDNEGMYDQHIMPYGRGTFQWDECMKALKAIGYNGLFNLEIPGDTSAPIEILKAKLRYIKEVAAYMATLVI